MEVLRRQPGHQMINSQSLQPVKETLFEKNTTDTEIRQDQKGEEETTTTTVKESANPATSPLVSTAVQTEWAGLIEEELILDPLNIEEQPNDSFEDYLPQHINFEVSCFSLV